MEGDVSLHLRERTWGRAHECIKDDCRRDFLAFA
jgi:hypothetical protein